MRYLIALLSIILFYSSCSNNAENSLTVFRVTGQSLEQSNIALSVSSEHMYKSMNERLNDPRTAERTAYWQPKTAQIAVLSAAVITYINKLKVELINEAGYKMVNNSQVLNDDNYRAVNNIFIKKNKGEELYKRLMDFISRVDRLDAQINVEFKELIKNMYHYLDSGKIEEERFSHTYFNRVPTAAALTMLTKIENDIRITENKLVTYCFYRTTPIIETYTKFQALTGLSSSCVKPGENIEVTAGVGAFTAASQPKISVNGNLIPLNENGFVSYTFKSSLKAGNYIIPVKIEFTAEDGIKQTMMKNLTYSVVEEK